MKKRILKKLSSQSGESIGETLVALLIAALALTMLAGAVSSAMNIVTRSKKSMDDYYTVNNAVVARATVQPSKNGLTVNGTVYHPNGLTLTVSGLNSTNDDYTVDYWSNQQISGTQVIAYTLSTPSPTIPPTP